MKNTKFVWLYIFSLAFLLQLFLPWWSIALVSITLGAWLCQKSLHAFLSGFTGIGLLWLFASTYIHLANNGILAGRVAEMMSLPNALSIILVTAFIGGLVGGISAMTGFLIKDAVAPKLNITETSHTLSEK
ncbi:MAG: hypothetical protein WD267_04660 [Balneolales bacterium]